jgi:hypothetical protein
MASQIESMAYQDQEMASQNRKMASQDQKMGSQVDRLIYAVTVHRSQGMTLNRAVVVLKVPFSEQGQLYVALSRVTDPRNLCLLLPDDQERELSDIQIYVPVDRQIVRIISRLDLRSTSSGHLFKGGRNNQGLEPGQ